MPNVSFEDFFTLAERDYLTCLALEKMLPDESYVGNIAYHIQQAIEKALKGLILFYGEEPEYTHSILKLCVHLKRLGGTYPELLDDIADTLTIWEQESRYDAYIVFSMRKYDMAKDVYLELHSILEMIITEIKETEIEQIYQENIDSEKKDSFERD